MGQRRKTALSLLLPSFFASSSLWGAALRGAQRSCSRGLQLWSWHLQRPISISWDQETTSDPVRPDGGGGCGINITASGPFTPGTGTHTLGSHPTDGTHFSMRPPPPQRQISADNQDEWPFPPLSFTWRWGIWLFPSQVQGNLSSSPGACKERKRAFPALHLAPALACPCATSPGKGLTQPAQPLLNVTREHKF